MSVIETPQTTTQSGRLQELFVPRENVQKRLLTLPRINLNPRQVHDLELLLVGAFSPLAGYLNEDTYHRVLDTMLLPTGEIWPIPITLDVEEQQTPTPGDERILCDRFGNPLAILRVESVYRPDKRNEAWAVYGTDDPSHPGVQRLLHDTGPVYIGGSLEGIGLSPAYDFADLRHTPNELRKNFRQNNVERIIGFQTRNPLHRVHIELIQRAAREHAAHILLHPVVGLTRDGDIDYITRVRSYRRLHQERLRNIATLSVLPLAMRMAGPREALWHAIIRKNYGCTHFIVGRDHAGCSAPDGTPYYEPYAAQELVANHADDIGITPVPFEELVYVQEEDAYLPNSAVKDHHTPLRLSGSKLRTMIRNGEEIPEWVSFPEVIEELRTGIAREERRGYTIFFTGLPSSGKSTIAHVLYTKLLELQNRSITVLDGDVIRQHLSRGLGFSQEDRNANVERIGFVASEVAKHGGIAICAAVSPYAKARAKNRALIERNGTYIEVFVATPIDVCAQRDPKGLYKKAREGRINNFTGVDDPYEIPRNPELTLDTTQCTPEECADQIIAYLREQKMLRS